MDGPVRGLFRSRTVRRGKGQVEGRREAGRATARPSFMLLVSSRPIDMITTVLFLDIGVSLPVMRILLRGFRSVQVDDARYGRVPVMVHGRGRVVVVQPGRGRFIETKPGNSSRLPAVARLSIMNGLNLSRPMILFNKVG